MRKQRNSHASLPSLLFTCFARSLLKFESTTCRYNNFQSNDVSSRKVTICRRVAQSEEIQLCILIIH